MSRLTGKVAVITGGAGGIGRAAARLFTAEGAQVLLVDLNEAALQQAVQDTGSDQASYMAVDVTQPEPMQQAINTAVERYGGLDILLANAGVEGEVHLIPDYPVEVFDHVSSQYELEAIGTKGKAGRIRPRQARLFSEQA